MCHPLLANFLQTFSYTGLSCSIGDCRQWGYTVVCCQEFASISWTHECVPPSPSKLSVDNQLYSIVLIHQGLQAIKVIHYCAARNLRPSHEHLDSSGLIHISNVCGLISEIWLWTYITDSSGLFYGHPYVNRCMLLFLSRKGVCTEKKGHMYSSGFYLRSSWTDILYFPVNHCWRDMNSCKLLRLQCRVVCIT